VRACLAAGALGDAKVQLKDLSFVETHDCFTIAELIEYEAMGLTAEGRGAVAAVEGWTQIDGTSGQSIGWANS
jgi:acetyl-CoA C-acetyltransferase